MSNPTEAQILANRRNAQHSTGPKTQEGKDICRGNAMKHGHCALVIDTPEEESANLNQREAEWQKQLNPMGRSVQAYMINLAVRSSGKIDRLHLVQHQKLAKLSRNAIKSIQKQRQLDVEAMARLIPDEPDKAVRQLKTTTNGCEWLLTEWRSLLITLAPAARFDNDDEMQIIMLLGRYRAILGKSPSPVCLELAAILEHRETVKRLKNNLPWPNYYGKDRYPTEYFRELDEKKLPDLVWPAEVARLKVIQLVDSQIKELTTLKAQLEIDEAIDEASLPTEAMFDASDDGKLLHRYELENARTFSRLIKEINALDALEAKQSQDHSDNRVTSDNSSVNNTSAETTTDRNRPNPAPPDTIFLDLKESKGQPRTTENMNMTVAPRVKPQL